MYKFLSYFLFFFLLSLSTVSAQEFKLHLNPIQINGFGGLQSYSYGQYEHDILLVGGRLDGLHRRQPWASFDLAGHNDQLMVVNPETGEMWKQGLTGLPVELSDQLKSTNMCFNQKGDYLFVAGGYGFSEQEQDHITFPILTIIDVPEMISAIKNGTELSGHIQSISSDQMAVTGGYLNRIEDEFFLVGGQKFNGRYNPMGPNHGPGFEQEYTNEIRRFRIEGTFPDFSISRGPVHRDEVLLHRRDYNVVEQILPNGEQGMIAFSGVFQKDIDLPYLNAVIIDSSGYREIEGFEQLYNHYHCATIAMYSNNSQEMSTVFFGGIAQFYEQNGTLVQDNNVPFVKTIARVVVDKDGQVREEKLEEEMPGFLGASSEFLPLNNLPTYPNGVIDYDALPDSSHIGYVLGGISSSDRNIFWINDGSQSSTSEHLFEVSLIKSNLSSTVEPSRNEPDENDIQLKVYPNPNNGHLFFSFETHKTYNVRIKITDAQGKELSNEYFEKLPADHYGFEKKLDILSTGHYIILHLEIDQSTYSRKIIIE